MDINAFIATMPGRGLPGFFGGIALILGLATRYVAALLLLFVIIATLSSHRYWEFAEAAPPRAQDNNFSKNLAINARGGQERTGETLTKAASSGPAQPAPLLGPCHLAPCSGGDRPSSLLRGFQKGAHRLSQRIISRRHVMSHLRGHIWGPGGDRRGNLLCRF